MLREPQEEHQIGRSLGHDLDSLDDRKLEGLVFLTQFREHDRGYRVQGKDSSNVPDACAVTIISESCGYRSGEGQHEGKESRTDAEYGHERVGIDLPWIHSFLVGESEAAGLQSEDQDDLQHGDIGHELSYHTVAFRSEKPGVDRDEKEVYDTGQDGAETINHGLTGQLFQWICHNDCKISYFCTHSFKTQTK